MSTAAARLKLTFLPLLALGAALAPSASADVSYARPVVVGKADLSPATKPPSPLDIDSPTLAVDPAGNATLAWRADGLAPAYYDSDIRTARYLASGAVSPARKLATLPAPQVDSGGGYLLSPRVAVDPAGRATVVFDQSLGTGIASNDPFRFGVAQIDPSGEPLPPQTPDPDQSSYDPQVVIDADGAALVAWREGAQGLGFERIDPAGTAGPVRSFPDVCGPGCELLGIDVSGGRPSLAWKSRQAVQAAQMRPSGELGSVQTLLRGGGSVRYGHPSLSAGFIYAFSQREGEPATNLVRVTLSGRKGARAVARSTASGRPLNLVVGGERGRRRFRGLGR